jgi:hypothetical protein
LQTAPLRGKSQTLGREETASFKPEILWLMKDDFRS